MADAYLLSDQDRQKLLKLMVEHGMSTVTHKADEPLPNAPEVYIARVQNDPDTDEEGSIPSLANAGTGEDYSHPGCAVCDIYKVVESESETYTWDLVPISDLSYPVFNISKSSIGSTWIPVIRDKSGRWLAIYTEADIHFELKADKVPGTEAAAYPLIDDGSGGEEPDTEADTFDVFDQTLGKQWRALGSDTTTTDGARGIARTNPITGNLEIVQMLEQAKRVIGTATAAVAEGDPTFYIGSVEATDGGQLPTLDGEDELEITNDGYKICNGDEVKCEWHENDQLWHPYDAKPCC